MLRYLNFWSVIGVSTPVLMGISTIITVRLVKAEYVFFCFGLYFIPFIFFPLVLYFEKVQINWWDNWSAVGKAWGICYIWTTIKEADTAAKSLPSASILIACSFYRPSYTNTRSATPNSRLPSDTSTFLICISECLFCLMLQCQNWGFPLLFLVCELHLLTIICAFLSEKKVYFGSLTEKNYLLTFIKKKKKGNFGQPDVINPIVSIWESQLSHGLGCFYYFALAWFIIYV